MGEVRLSLPAALAAELVVPQGTYVLVQRNDQAGQHQLAVSVESAMLDAAVKAESTRSSAERGEAIVG